MNLITRNGRIFFFAGLGDFTGAAAKLLCEHCRPTNVRKNTSASGWVSQKVSHALKISMGISSLTRRAWKLSSGALCFRTYPTVKVAANCWVVTPVICEDM